MNENENDELYSYTQAEIKTALFLHPRFLFVQFTNCSSLKALILLQSSKQQKLFIVNAALPSRNIMQTLYVIKNVLVATLRQENKQVK